ncbi:hypothetical protein niasHT_010612 [Heterodera trifolii]|uniref:Uncharacterized protein n=1 Tax=Heterodera trifolii TaxID=157864 RepID=A0ABD2L8Z5_9BILA
MESRINSKTPKFSRPLPTELLLEQIMCIPLMHLFNSNGGPQSTISAINWKFEVLRNGRKNAHAKAKKAISEIVKKYNMASRARKLEFEGDNLDFSSLREENGLTKDEFRKEILLYLCYGGNEAAMLVNNVAITVPILNYIFIRPLLEQLFEFILESPNPFTMQKRICVGGHHPIHLPKSLSLPARVMASKGIHPQVRSDDKEIYNFFNGHLKRVRLLSKVKSLEEKVATLERENHHLHILAGMKMEPLDEEPMDTLVPGQKFVCGPTSFSMAFELEKLKLSD